MNREIKFRTWDPLDKIMHTDDDHVSFVDGSAYLWQVAHPTHALGTLFKPVEIDCPVMQYTGVKDKNGRDVYEGDIVRAYSEGYSHIGVIRWRDAQDGGGCPCYIIYPAWADGQFWHLNGGSRQQSLEVLGNIYENPDLAPASSVKHAEDDA